MNTRPTTKTAPTPPNPALEKDRLFVLRPGSAVGAEIENVSAGGDGNGNKQGTGGTQEGKAVAQDQGGQHSSSHKADEHYMRGPDGRKIWQDRPKNLPNDPVSQNERIKAELFQIRDRASVEGVEAGGVIVTLRRGEFAGESFVVEMPNQSGDPNGLYGWPDSLEQQNAIIAEKIGIPASELTMDGVDPLVRQFHTHPGSTPGSDYPSHHKNMMTTATVTPDSKQSGYVVTQNHIFRTSRVYTGQVELIHCRHLHPSTY